MQSVALVTFPEQHSSAAQLPQPLPHLLVGHSALRDIGVSKSLTARLSDERQNK